MSVLDEVLTAAEAAALYGLDDSTVKKACQEMRILARKSARTWLVIRADAEMLWGKRRRAFVSACIGDDDVVTADLPDGGFAQAWMDGWHRDEQGEDVPAVYNLQVNDKPPRQFETLKELLDAMAEFAPFDAWRVEGEE